MGSSDDEMSPEERREFMDKMMERSDGVERIDGSEDWHDMMPNQSPSIGRRVLIGMSQVAILAMIFSPAILFVVVGFEQAVVAFLCVYLLFVAQSS